jgi:DNA-binding NarL/FixJ family response regulator
MLKRGGEEKFMSSACPQGTDSEAACVQQKPWNQEKPVRILVAYQYPIVLHALKVLLEGQGYLVVGEASNRQEATMKVAELRPDVAIIDFEMPAVNGLEVAKDLMEASPETKTILLTNHTEECYALQAARAGVKGYLLKTKTPREVLESIAAVSRGGTYFSPEVSSAILRHPYRADSLTDPLTDREKQVLILIAEGLSTKEIAAVLGISFKTADCHRSRIMDKLDLHETASLVRYAIRRGLVQP